MSDPRSSIYALQPAELAPLFAELGQPAYRARQLWRWLYQGLAASFDEMTDLPLALRDALAQRYRFDGLSLLTETSSQDSPAQKFLFGLADGQSVETVLMHYLDPADEPAEDMAGQPESEPDPAIPTGRHTVCLSTQAGCAMGCVFCATGQMGLLRDLDAAECIEQVVYCARRLRAAGEKLDNVVFMGMGEPLANWPATWATIQRLVDPEGLALSPRRLTISTVGIVPGIRKLAEVGLPLRLAVSLHAPDDALRSRLVAVNSVYGLDAILDACRAYQAAGGRRITFEYVLIQEVNDSPEQAKALARRISGVNAHCNLIPLNPTEGSRLEPSSPARAEAFQAMLRNCGVMATLRMRRGIDVAAGCGQLRARDGAGLLGRTIPLSDIPRGTI